jgi:predicted transcriptional regulator
MNEIISCAEGIHSLAILQASKLLAKSGGKFELTNQGQQMSLKVHEADKLLMVANPTPK